MGEQKTLFNVTREYTEKLDTKYTSKIQTPIYEPKECKPCPQKLVNICKTERLLQHIKNSSLPEEEKAFLRLAAQRHLVFDFSKIADYYAHASTEMQELMEESTLVIIDFQKAIEEGFSLLADEVEAQFILEETNE